METGLQLLMRDGAVRVAFHPRLTPEQYVSLLERVGRAGTKDELRTEMRAAAKAWGSRLDFDTEIG
jgi:hypothetical protein